MATYSKCIEVSAGVKPCADKINRSTWISSHLEERSLFTQCQGNDLHYKIDYNGVSFVISSFETRHFNECKNVISCCGYLPAFREIF